MTSIKKRPPPTASNVLSEYGNWLNIRYGKIGNYLTNAKTFLRNIKSNESLGPQLEIYSETKSLTIQSILRRFMNFLEERSIIYISNDLHNKPLPRSNIYIKVYLLHYKDRLQGQKSTAIYATVLSQYFRFIGEDIRSFNNKTAERFIHSPNLSDHTKRLYKSILKNFSEWALKFRETIEKDLTSDEKQVKRGIKRISAKSLREICH